MGWVHADTLQVLRDWAEGKAIKSIELGHSHRMKPNPMGGGAPVVDESKFYRRDQARAHAYCFFIMEWAATDHNSPFVTARENEHEVFLGMCNEFAKTETFKGLTPEEKEGAESLAWKAMRVGWVRAIAGHEFYIEVKAERAAA